MPSERSRRRPAPSPPRDATIDASGQTILLTARNLQTNRSSLRIASPGAPTADLFVSDGYLPSITDDGRMVVETFLLHTGTPQAHLIGIDGDGDQALTNQLLRASGGHHSRSATAA